MRGRIATRSSAVQENEMKLRARMLATIAVTAAFAPVFLLQAQEVAPAELRAVSLNASVPSLWETPALPSAPDPQSAPRTQYGTPRVELFLGYSRFGVGFNSSAGTIGNRMVGLNGGSASLAFNFNRFVALVADIGGYDDSQLQLSGTGANQPLTVNSSGTAFTYLFGPRFTIGKQRRVSVFAQVLAGGVHASAVTVTNCTTACTPLPVQNALAITAGGGVDIRLSHHISLRPIQAEYMLTRFAAVPSGSSASQNDLRLSSGLVFRFGGRPVPAAPQPIAAVQPPPPPPPVAPPPPPPPPPTPPTISCSASPQSIYSGASATITSLATSAHNGALMYTYSASAGSIAGSNATAVLTAVGSGPGPIAVTCNVSDDLGMTASANTTVNIMAAAPLAAPQRRDLCTISFERDSKRPVRVDNEAKACLDDIALTMQRDAGGRLVIVGNYAPNETPKAGLERAANERQYLTGEKGIDSQRIELRAGKAGDRTAANVFLPEGATF
jgi:hypothetical protein